MKFSKILSWMLLALGVLNLIIGWISFNAILTNDPNASDTQWFNALVNTGVGIWVISRWFRARKIDRLTEQLESLRDRFIALRDSDSSAPYWRAEYDQLEMELKEISAELQRMKVIPKED